MAAVVFLIQKIIRVSNTEIGSLLLLGGKTQSKEEEESTLNSFKEWKQSFKFRRFKINFAVKILYWNVTALLLCIAFFRKGFSENSSERKTLFLT